MELPDDVETYKSINYIKRHCSNIYFCDINGAFFGYNKNNKRCTVHVLK